jgi:ketopantoate hydroxymethyltransferase
MRYSKDVRSKVFPEDEHAYKMMADELPKLLKKLE